jgi:hypothetical protein
LNAAEYQYRSFQNAEAHAILAAEVLGLVGRWRKPCATEIILRGGMLGGERRLPASDTEAVRWSKERLYLVRLVVETEMEGVNTNANVNAVVYGMRME